MGFKVIPRICVAHPYLHALALVHAHIENKADLP